jgi:hypothetical protein
VSRRAGEDVRPIFWANRPNRCQTLIITLHHHDDYHHHRHHITITITITITVTSYLERTVSWDEFPNGRWGNSASPAFGTILVQNLNLILKRDLILMYNLFFVCLASLVS